MTPVKNETIQVPCSPCGGTGKVPLNETLASTLRAIEQRQSLTVGEAWAIALRERAEDQISVTAMNNRLEELRRLGLVERKREGRAWRYFATKPTNNPTPQCLP